MAAATSESAFSGNGQFFTNLSTDGRLKLWECESGTAKQEYILPSHLSAVCTCLVWAPIKQAEQVKIIKLDIYKCYEFIFQSRATLHGPLFSSLMIESNAQTRNYLRF